MGYCQFYTTTFMSPGMRLLQLKCSHVHISTSVLFVTLIQKYHYQNFKKIFWYTWDIVCHINCYRTKTYECDDPVQVIQVTELLNRSQTLSSAGITVLLQTVLGRKLPFLGIQGPKRWTDLRNHSHKCFNNILYTT